MGPPLVPKQHWKHQGPVDPGDEEQLPSPSLRNEKSTETSETILYIPPWNLGNLRMIMPCCNYTVTLWSGESSMGGCVMPDTSFGCQLRYQSKHTKDLRSKFEHRVHSKANKTSFKTVPSTRTFGLGMRQLSLWLTLQRPNMLHTVCLKIESLKNRWKSGLHPGILVFPRLRCPAQWPSSAWSLSCWADSGGEGLGGSSDRVLKLGVWLWTPKMANSKESDKPTVMGIWWYVK